MKSILLGIGVLSAITAIWMAFQFENEPSFDSAIHGSTYFVRTYHLAIPAAGLAVFGGLCCLGAALIETFGSRQNP